jgi:hypothetical protein
MDEEEIPSDVPDDSQRIWRYMDFSKYVDLVTASELHFTRADRLEDPYDCSGMQFLGEQHKKLSSTHPQMRERDCQVNTFDRLFVYVNCWHIGDVESAALWRLYSENRHETIAIQTTIGKLKAEKEGKWPRDIIRMCQVRYDPQNGGKPIGSGRLFSSSGWESIVYKRPSFVHERELRAFVFQGCDKLRESNTLRNESHLAELMEKRPRYIRIPIIPSRLIEKVYVSPHAKELFVELAKRVSGELKDRVVKSDLYEVY